MHEHTEQSKKKTLDLICLNYAAGTMSRHDRLYISLLSVFASSLVAAVTAMVMFRSKLSLRSQRDGLQVACCIVLIYLIWTLATLAVRLIDAAKARPLTRSLNIMLLLHFPFGTALGIYGLLKVDKRSAGAERPEKTQIVSAARSADTLTEDQAGIDDESMNPILIEISPGELMDRISILRLKAQHLEGDARLSVQRELSRLLAPQETIPASEQLRALGAELAEVNRQLWLAEDELRQCERRQDFGPEFIQLARSVYQHNDRRSAIKLRINQMLGAAFSEPKVYAAG